MKIKEHIKELHTIDNHRKGWLVLSAVVAIGILGIVFKWDHIHSNNVIWLVVGLGLIVSMIWWYWTMRLVRHLIHFKVVESEILIEIVNDIRHVKEEVKNMSRPVDNDK